MISTHSLTKKRRETTAKTISTLLVPPNSKTESKFNFTQDIQAIEKWEWRAISS